MERLKFNFVKNKFHKSTMQDLQKYYMRYVNLLEGDAASEFTTTEA